MPRVSGSTCLKYSVGTGKVCLGENPEDSEIEEVECKKKKGAFICIILVFYAIWHILSFRIFRPFTFNVINED